MKIFTTIADLEQANLKEGQLVVTLENSSGNQNSIAYFRIYDSNTTGGYTLANGNKAIYQEISPVQTGGVQVTPVSLSLGQTVVTTPNAVQGSRFEVVGSGTDNGLLLETDDYTVTGDSEITLTRSYPDGTKLVQIIGTDVTGIDLPVVYQSIVQAKQAQLTAGTLVRVPSRGNAEYIVEPSSYTPIADGYGDHTMDDGKVLRLVHGGEVNVLWFGADKSGVADSTQHLQAGLDYTPTTGSLYLPKGTYRTTSTLTLTVGDITVFSDPESEYSTVISFEGAGSAIDVQAPAISFYYIGVRGIGTDTGFGSQTAITFDRRPQIGESDNSGNLDVIIANCVFQDTEVGLDCYGRNVLVKDNLFSHQKVAVKLNGWVFQAGNAQDLDVRGWRVTGNRFHSIGWVYGKDGLVTPTGIENIDAWCVHTPFGQEENFCRHIEVSGNNFDRCYAGFYRGTTAGLALNNNVAHDHRGVLVYSVTTVDTYNTVRDNPCVISGNNVSTDVNYSDPTYNKYGGKLHGIYLDGAKSTTISGNAFGYTKQQAVVIKASSGVILQGNNINNAGQDFVGGGTKNPAVLIEGSDEVIVDSLRVGNRYGSSINTAAVECDGTCSSVTIGDVVEDGCDVSVIATPQELSGSTARGLEWVLPSLTAPFTYSQGLGYRRMLNGTVLINLRVLGNGAASGSTVFTLPVGCRPVSDTVHYGVGSSNLAGVSISSSTGEVKVTHTAASTLYSIQLAIQV